MPAEIRIIHIKYLNSVKCKVLFLQGINNLLLDIILLCFLFSEVHHSLLPLLLCFLQGDLVQSFILLFLSVVFESLLLVVYRLFMGFSSFIPNILVNTIQVLMLSFLQLYYVLNFFHEPRNAVAS